MFDGSVHISASRSMKARNAVHSIKLNIVHVLYLVMKMMAMRVFIALREVDNFVCVLLDSKFHYQNQLSNIYPYNHNHHDVKAPSLIPVSVQ